MLSSAEKWFDKCLVRWRQSCGSFFFGRARDWIKEIKLGWKCVKIGDDNWPWWCDKLMRRIKMVSCKYLHLNNGDKLVSWLQVCFEELLLRYQLVRITSKDWSENSRSYPILSFPPSTSISLHQCANTYATFYVYLLLMLSVLLHSDHFFFFLFFYLFCKTFFYFYFSSVQSIKCKKKCQNLKK